MFPVVEIVAAPRSGASVVMSLNDPQGAVRIVKSVGGERPAFDLGYAADDDTVRQIEIGLRVVAPSSHSSAISAFSAVGRALMVAGRWLHVKMSSDAPSTWFKLNPKASGELDFSRVYLADDAESLWAWDLTFEAVGAGYGERVTMPAFTVTNAELGKTIPFEVEGDVPTMAQVDVQPLGVQSWGTWRSMLNITPVLPSCPLGASAGEVDSPVPPVISWEAEAFTPESEATVHSSGGLSGGQGVRFAETNGTWRPILSGTVPVKPPPGTYQVLARVWRLSAGAGGAHFRIGHLGWNVPLDIRTARWNPASGTSYLSWLVLGDMSFPAGLSGEGLTSDDMTTPSIRLYARGLAVGAANGTILVDRFALVPRRLSEGDEARTALAKWGAAGPASFADGLWNGWRVDGEHAASGLINVTRDWYSSAAAPQWSGGYPRLHPGMRNILTILHHTSADGSGADDMSKSVSVVVSYYPRFAHLAS